jgi:hypothetical protein
VCLFLQYGLLRVYDDARPTARQQRSPFDHSLLGVGLGAARRMFCRVSCLHRRLPQTACLGTRTMTVFRPGREKQNSAVCLGQEQTGRNAWQLAGWLQGQQTSGEDDLLVGASPDQAVQNLRLRWSRAAAFRRTSSSALTLSGARMAPERLHPAMGPVRYEARPDIGTDKLEPNHRSVRSVEAGCIPADGQERRSSALLTRRRRRSVIVDRSVIAGQLAHLPRSAAALANWVPECQVESGQVAGGWR